MRTNQGGSVVSFLVVGIIFVAIAVAAVYALQHRTTDSGINKPSSQLSPSISQTTDGSSSVAPSPSSKPAAPTAPAPQKTTGPTTPAPGSGSPSNPSANMPVTGPSDMMPSGVVIAVLIGVTVAFAQSVKARRQLSV